MTGPFWYKALLSAHVLAGFGAFLIAPVALATAKGGKQHRRWGMVYLWAIGVMAATAIVLAFYRPILFLALVAVFSFYLAFSGYRVLRLKSLATGGRPAPIDWIAALVTLAASAWLAWLGAFHAASIQVIPAVGIIFGLIGMRAALVQLWSFVRKPREKMFWWYSHLGGFIGSYIAAWSAFSAVTLVRILGNEWYVWLWPSILGVPAIVIITGYYRRKFAPRSVPAALTQQI